MPRRVDCPYLCLYCACMTIVAKAGESLRRCEHELRELGAESLREGDYETARRITELAEALADRRARAGLGDNEPAPAKVPASKTTSSQATASGKSASKSKARGAARTKRNAGADYPRFMRRGEKLVKVGWSKKNKREYEHTTPWAAVLAFAGHLRSHTRPGRIFKVEDLMPVPDVENETELPGYQIYLALAWFREAGLVEKRGREGYVAHNNGLDDETLAQRWGALPSRDT